MNQTKRILALALALVFVFASFTTLIAAAAEAVANPTKGDVNKNGKIDMTDYILTKRAYFNTYKLSEEQLDLADINCNDKLDMTDYILLKRMYFGTYKLPVVPETPEEDTSSDVSEDTSSDVSEDTSSDVSEDTSSNLPSTPDEDTSSDTSSEDTSSDDTSSEEAALGTFDNPYIAVLNAMRIAVTIPAGGEAYVKASDSDGNILTVGYATGSDYFAVYCRQTINPEGEDNTMAITMNADVDFVYFMNTSETDDVVLYITLVEGAPVDTTGTMDNPAEITLSEMFGALRGMGEGEVAAGGDGYWFKVVAPADGMIAVSVGAADAEYNFLDWMYCVNNTTAGKYGDNHWSDDEEVVYNEMVSVSEGDIVTIFVNTYNPEDMFNAPAGTVSATVSFSPAGSPEVPFTAVIGDNTATGSDTGAFYTYTATGDGTLTLTISDENTLGWTYFVNNLTSCVYGDTQWSDSDPVLNSFDVAVSEGDEIQIMVNTYDPADMWNAPEGEIKWSLSFTPVATTNLVAGKEYSASAEGYTQYTAENYGLTDGYTNRWTAYNSTAFCWATANTTDLKGYFVFDLGAYCTVYDVNTHIYVYEVSGIKVPAEINVYVSNDGETYTALGTSVLPSYDTSTNNWDEVRWATLSEKATDVRFVKVEFVINYGMNLVDEIQVLGIVTEELAPATPDEEDTSSEDTSSEDTSSEDTSSEDTSSEDTSSEDTSSEDTSSEDTSSEDTSSEDTSSEPEEPTADEEEPVVNPSSNVVTVWNAGYNATNDAIIYTDADVYSSATIGWWRHIALAPV